MSEDVIAKLGAFTPSAIDRDAILFAAGRASARPSKFWKHAAIVLFLTQLTTLGVMVWPGSRAKTDPVNSSIPPSASPKVSEFELSVPDDAPPSPNPYSLLALRFNPEPLSESSLNPNSVRPPVMAFSRDYQP